MLNRNWVMHMLSCGGFDQWLVRCCLTVIMSSPNFLILFSCILNYNSSMRRRLFFLLYSNKNCIILSSKILAGFLESNLSSFREFVPTELLLNFVFLFLFLWFVRVQSNFKHLYILYTIYSIYKTCRVSIIVCFFGSEYEMVQYYI